MSYVYLPEFFLAEHQVAENLIKLLGNKCDEIPYSTEGLVHNQPEAVVNACTKRFSVITGCAGTGKTTTLKSIINAFEEAQMTGAICCPTGKAAKRAYNVVNAGREVPVSCSTAHRLLGFNYQIMGFNHDENNPFDLDYVVIDEFSMCDLRLFNSILNAINPERTRLILCGDPFQLPSISPGNIGRDIIGSGVFPVARLNKIVRQGDKSGIVYNSHRILKGEKLSEVDDNEVKFSDFFVIYSDDDTKSHEKIVFYVTKALEERRGIKPNEVQVIAPGKKGAVGVDKLNNTLRDVLNPRNKEQHGFRVNDKVVINKNNYRKDVVNGDTGYVTDVSKDFLKVQVDGGQEVTFTGEDMGTVKLAYAFTVHKSQGSEFRAVVYPVHGCHWILHSRNLFYTGVTRGKEITVVIGDKKSIAYSIRNNKTVMRNTRLKELIVTEAQKKKVTA